MGDHWSNMWDYLESTGWMGTNVVVWWLKCSQHNSVYLPHLIFVNRNCCVCTHSHVCLHVRPAASLPSAYITAECFGSTNLGCISGDLVQSVNGISVADRRSVVPTGRCLAKQCFLLILWSSAGVSTSLTVQHPLFLCLVAHYRWRSSWIYCLLTSLILFHSLTLKPFVDSLNPTCSRPEWSQSGWRPLFVIQWYFFGGDGVSLVMFASLSSVPAMVGPNQHMATHIVILTVTQCVIHASSCAQLFIQTTHTFALPPPPLLCFPSVRLSLSFSHANHEREMSWPLFVRTFYFYLYSTYFLPPYAFDFLF